MKRCVWVLSVLVLLAVFADVCAAASRFAIGARVGQNFYRDGSIDVNWAGHGRLGRIDYSNKNSWIFGATGTFQLNEYVSFEVALDRINSSQCDFKSGASSLKAGNFTQTPLTFTARAHYPVGIFSPYLGAGLGYYWRSFDKDLEAWYASTAVSMDNSWGYHVNGGTDIFLTDKKDFALNVDLKYVWTKTDLKSVNGSETISGSMDLNSFVTTIGLKYFF